jgi:hypothetical protein
VASASSTNFRPAPPTLSCSPSSRGPTRFTSPTASPDRHHFFKRRSAHAYRFGANGEKRFHLQ